MQQMNEHEHAMAYDKSCPYCSQLAQAMEVLRKENLELKSVITKLKKSNNRNAGAKPKFTPAQKAQIFKEYAIDGVSVVALAVKYQTCSGTIYKYINEMSK